MRAVLIRTFGPPDVLIPETIPVPTPGPDDVLIRSHAAALNYSDLLQRQGRYAVAPDLPAIPGVECAGKVVACGDRVQGIAVGDPVCALVNGGGYGEMVCAPAGHVMPWPGSLSAPEAASLPEAACTIWSNLIDLGRLQPGQRLLVHGGSGGMGSFAVQLGRAIGCQVFCTASAAKLDFCRNLGANRVIDYGAEDFAQVIADETGGKGVDVILDTVGASYLERNIAAAADDGRIMVIGLQGGRRCEIALDLMMKKRLSLLTTSLRDRNSAEKTRIVAGATRDILPLVTSGALRLPVDRVFPHDAAAEAHRYMESGLHSGKIVLTMGVPNGGD